MDGGPPALAAPIRGSEGRATDPVEGARVGLRPPSRRAS
jgi:hypothetical protein